MAAINLDIGGDTRRLDRDIQKTVNRVYSINLKTKGDQPLGRITGKVNEFTKSLDASNARVIAFGASAGIIFGLQRAFSALVSSTIEVQKSLQDINVILNVSAQNLQKFGGELFNIAKNTGQSFQEVAKAATEFSRQGLGVEETLKRTNEALILSRLSGLDAAKSVEALTAAVNSYASQAVTATEIVNKFATVDAAFAVSSADLADAIARVGSSAAQSGVSLNELIAIVTSAQQTTARGGAVIGNSFKTIFTRLQRGRVVDLLGTLGISDTDSSGQLKSTIQLLQDLGRVYDTLGARQQAAVAEQVGGVFQINILKAALADLGKEYSIYNNALNVASGATDQAIRRNEELNKTYAAQLNALQENAKQLAATGGERLLGPTIDRLVGGTNTLLSGFNESDGQSVGAVLGKGILDGLGQFIAGPGLALIGGVLLKLFRDLGKFATGSVQQLLGLNTAAIQQRDLQASIQQILSKNPQLLELALKGEQGLNTVANSLLASLQKQTVELQKQAQVAQQISKAFISQAGVRVSGGIPVVPTGKASKPGKAAGYIPNFANLSSGVTPGDAMAEVIGAANNNYKIQPKDVYKTRIYDGQGGSFISNVNKKEDVATKTVDGVKGTFVVPPTGFAAKGFVPNFAAKINKTYGPGVIKGPQSSQIADQNLDRYTQFSLDTNTISSKSVLNDKFYKELNNLNSSDPNVSEKAARFLERNGVKRNEISQLKQNLLSNEKNVPSLLSNNKLVKQTRQVSGVKNNVLGKNLFEKLAARRLGLVRSQDPNSRIDLTDKKGNPVAEVKYGKIGEDNIVSKVIESTYGRNRFKDNQPETIGMPSRYKLIIPGLASGFVPNFAKTSPQKEPPVQLGNLDKIPNKLGNKVLSLIYPGISEGYTLRPATASYLKKQYTGNIPVAGISQKKLQSQLPDIDKNIGNLLVKEANQFGQALGGFNFLQSPEELPNYGAAKSAVGVAFEGGVQTLLQQRVGKQNAGIDFRNITPRLRSVFNNAPGLYDAKRSPELTNEVLQKLLNETKPGAIVQKRSGKAGKEYLAQRSAAVNQLRQEGITRSADITKALKDRFGIVGKAAGYIPNFAAEADAKKREISRAGSAVTLYSKMLRSPVVVNEPQIKEYGPNADKIIQKDHINKGQVGTRSNLMKTGSGKEKYKSRGFIPNFAETPESGAASIGTAATAIAAQLSTLAFSFAFSKNEVQGAMTELAKSTKAAASTQRNETKKQIQAKRAEIQKPIRQEAAASLRQERAQIKEKVRTNIGAPAVGPLTQKQQEQYQKQVREANRKATERTRGNVAQQTSATLRKDPMLAQQRQASRQAAKPSGLARAGAFGKANALGLGIAAPILAQTISQGIPQETKNGRVAATAVGSLGNIGAATATGAMFGPIGAAVGLAAGSLLEIPNIVGAASTNFPELQAAVQKSSQSLTKFSDAGSQLLTSFESLQTALSNPNTSQEMINKASEAYSKALMGLSSEDQNRLKKAAEIGKLEDEYAKILAEKTSELKSRESAAEAGRIAGDAEKTNNLINGALGIAKTIPGLAPTVFAAEQSGLVESLRPKALELGSKEEKVNQQAFIDQVLQGKSGAGAIEALQTAGGTGFTKELLNIKPGDTQALENLLNKTIPDGAGKADFVAAQIQMANNGLTDFGNVTGSLAQIFNQTILKAKESKETSDALIESQKAEAAAKKEAVKATSEIIDSLQRNIRAAQLMADANRTLALADRQFQRGTSFTDQFTRPTQTVNKIVGPDAPLAQTFGLREEIASIAFRQVEGIETQRTGLVNEINQSIKNAFADAVTETTAQATTEGTAADIQKSNQEILAPLANQQEKAFNVLQGVLDGVQFGEGGIGTEALLEKINQSLSEANINGKVIESITKNVKESADKGNLEIIKLRDQSVKEFKTLAKEQTQKILIAKIGQAQNFGGASVGGAIEEFINPKEPGQNVIDKVIESTKGFEQFQGQQADFRFDYMPGTDQFKYQNKEAKKARKEMAPERGRKALQLIDQLQDFTGYTPNAEGKGITAGVAGLKESIDAQIKELTNIAKTTSDPIVKEEITAALKEVNALGGTENIARLQVAQRTGALTETQFEKITGKFQSPVLEAMRQQAMALGPGEQRDALLKEIQTMSMDMLVSQDPTVNAINITNKILNQLLDVQKQAMKDAVTGEDVIPFDLESYRNEKDPAKRAAMKAGYTSSGVTPIDIDSYANEKDPAKRAAMKGKYLNAVQPVDMTKSEADKKATEIKKQVLPIDNRPMAEIEAETKLKRDQKYFQSQLSPKNLSTGERFKSIQEVDSEMNKALGLSAFNPDQKVYYEELQNFKKALDPTGGSPLRQEMFMYDEANSRITQPGMNQAIKGVSEGKMPYTQPLVDQLLDINKKTPVAAKSDEEKYKELNRPGQVFESFDDVFNNWAQRDTFQRTGKIPELETKTNKPAPQLEKQKSFTQQEAAFNSNTSALTTLAGGIESLNSTLSNFQSNFSNLNNTPGAQPVGAQGQANAQPGTTTTTNAPVSVIVNAQGSNDIATAVGAEVEKSIPTIINKVRAALGPPFNKVPPQVPKS